MLAGVAGRESMSAREDVKVEPSVLGSDDLKVYMPDPLYAEDDASIETTTCHFTLGDVDPEESGLPLFGNVSDEGKIDYTWDNCFGNLENVDNLLRLASHLAQVVLSSFLQVCNNPYCAISICPFLWKMCHVSDLHTGFSIRMLVIRVSFM